MVACWRLGFLGFILKDISVQQHTWIREENMIPLV